MRLHDMISRLTESATDMYLWTWHRTGLCDVTHRLHRQVVYTLSPLVPVHWGHPDTGCRCLPTGQTFWCGTFDYNTTCTWQRWGTMSTYYLILFKPCTCLWSLRHSNEHSNREWQLTDGILSFSQSLINKQLCLLRDAQFNVLWCRGPCGNVSFLECCGSLQDLHNESTVWHRLMSEINHQILSRTI